MSFIGLDFGRKRVGVAISHGIVAEAYKTLSYDEGNTLQFIKKIKDIVNEQRAKTIVVGLPLGRNGKDTDQSNWIKKQAEEHIKQIGLPIEYAEESFSSCEAAGEIGRKNKKELIDSYSAKIILEQFLNESRSTPLQ